MSIKTLSTADFKKGVSGVYLLNPSMAQELLDSQNGNRVLRENWALEIAGDIERQAWIYNGDSLKVDSHRHLIDGQHRCMAVTVVGKAIPTRIEFGIADEAMFTFDTNRTRTYSDMLHMQHETNSSNLAAATRLLWMYQIMALKNLDTPDKYSYRATKAQLQNTLETNPKIRESVAYVACHPVAMRLATPRCAAAAHYLAARINKEIADRAVDQLDSGAGLTVDSPIYVLRERLNTYIGTRGDKLHWSSKFALVIKALKAELAGTRMKVLRWSEGEKFPQFDEK